MQATAAIESKKIVATTLPSLASVMQVRWIRGTLVFIAYLAVAMYVSTIFLQHSGYDLASDSKLVKMVEGTASKPFVKRQLVPTVIRIVYKVAQVVGNANPVAERHYHEVFKALAAVFILAFLYIARSLLRESVTSKSLWSTVTPVALVMSLPAFFRFGYIYDLAVFPLVYGALLALKRQRLGVFAVLFVLASLNKETSVLLLPVFIAHQLISGHFNKRQTLIVSGILGLAYVGTMLLLVLIFKDNPGGQVQNHFQEQMNWFLRGYSAVEALVFLAFFTAVFSGWDAKPLILKTAIMMLPFLLATFIPFGYPEELRVFYEVYPAMFFLAAYSVARAFGVELSSSNQKSY